MYYLKKSSFTLISVFLIVFCCQAQDDSSISFLALGDSYTIGESVPEQQRWPIQLADSLTKHGFSVDRPEILAVTGWTTGDLLDGIQEASFNQPYDLVSLLIGVNNQYRGYQIERYRIEFEKLLNKAIRFAGNNPGRVFVVSIPDYGATPFGQKKNPEKIAAEINRYNEIAKQISDEYEVSFINITPISKEALKDPSLTADDALHPSGLMYERWVSQIFPVVLSKLQ